jgi:hypothetical protein
MKARPVPATKGGEAAASCAPKKTAPECSGAVDGIQPFVNQNAKRKPVRAKTPPLFELKSGE